MNIASGKIALQNKHDLMCHVATVKAATAHSMADIRPFFSVFNTPFESNASIRSNKKYFIHNKENNIRNIFPTLMFQQLLVNKHHRLRDSVPITIWPSGGLRLVTDIKNNNNNNKSHAEQEPRSAHGEVKSVYEPRGPSGRSLSRFP